MFAPAMVFRPRPNHPYAHAARFPDEGPVDIGSILPGEGPIEIEIGPGRGGFLFERAAAAPESRLLGLEIRLKWSSIVDDRLKKQGLGARARVLNADAREALSRLGPDASIDTFFMHFPDPWWKKKHAKRLVMGPGLLDSIARLLRDGGAFYVQTDVAERAEMYEAQVGAHEVFEPSGDEPGSARMVENPYNARSPREHHAIADGLPVTRLRYRRRPR
ncbi:tRNA (guanine(46)-N(7))-methyltransferase TrmB [Polyangium mundeleinium]|uniref:tRNA (guanine-N(7)-)-methyltransferase n=1 Tax=Polyangium mundeleinium TaxID=2995306 RepID=A0ABT5EJK0_9BACT|nr:tRNA (guanine-N7)-methyltransferase [Polyangium mundeleinium]MDC0741988.1 tRNA (guanine-N7)-methyltransferase [Polyangium mundeleinium]